MDAHLPTFLAAVGLGLSGLNGGPPLPPPLDRENLLRLRDALEVASVLPDTPLELKPIDHEAILMCLLATDAYLAGGEPITGPPDLLRALAPDPRRHVRKALEAQLEGQTIITLGPPPSSSRHV